VEDQFHVVRIVLDHQYAERFTQERFLLRAPSAAMGSSPPISHPGAVFRAP